MPPLIGTNSSFSSTESRSILLVPSRCSLDDVTNIQSMKTEKSIKKLNAEASKLRAQTAFIIAEAEETISNEMEAVYEGIEKTRLELEKTHKNNSLLKEEIAREENNIRYSEDLYARREKESRMEDRDSKMLEHRIDDLLIEKNLSKNEFERVEGLVQTMTDSTNHLLADQEKIIAASKRIENDLKEESARKISLLHSLLEMELSLKKESNAIKFIDGGNDDHRKTLTEAISRQKEKILRVLPTRN
mmetsp:Transcript_10674/g.16192  ORF Transcript_10674/g.16192 Transcript_10674/m.16192 type:complete len:246 (-) Transcript_10674:105-842(-)|eukprot:CAMPEP_0194117944 /NCGR_PEP_ID=MMETSP0150-20130528/33492_1 /TAXON_ID=122233 /ORGANISM="Chaetoceros debilis, Strain MM31A-1" /LENGTH=245 /DNA_ID=CAMNT_0038809145 /DNA_START=116 /DNA_END=853 /DNA_ORIENTATION=+